MLATATGGEDYSYLQLRDELAQFGFFFINEADLFIGLSSEDHTALPPQSLAEQEILHATTAERAGVAQVATVRDWFESILGKAA